jgi:hypothetical protein
VKLMQALVELREFRSLDLGDCRIGPGGMEALSRVLPNMSAMEVRLNGPKCSLNVP